MVLAAAVAVFALAPTASADHGNADLASPNMLHVDNVPRTNTQSQSDLAFWKSGGVDDPYPNHLLAAGNYDSLRMIDITDPENMRQLSDHRCRGQQNDVSFYQARDRLLLIASIDRPVTTPECETSVDTPLALYTHPITGLPVRLATPGFEGLRIFDVSNPTAPVLISAVPTACGSHTHTTIPDKDEQRALVYVSSYPTGSGVSPTESQSPDFGGPRCTIPHQRISIVEIPDEAPEASFVLKEQPLDIDTLPYHGSLGAGGTGAVGCHDIQTLFEANEHAEGNPRPQKEVAAAACLQEGQLWDISDPANPTTVGPGTHTHIRNPFITRVGPGAAGLFHSAAFTWDGEVVLFGDEWEGGGAHGCDGPQDTRGNIWFYDNVQPGTPIAPLYGRYIIPRPQPLNEICTMHNFNIIPTEDGYFGVSSANFGGTSVFDFTGIEQNFKPVPQPLTGAEGPNEIPTVAREIAFFDPQGSDSAPPGRVPFGSPWSSYWFNDYIYANDRRRGVDSFLLLGQNGRLLDRNGQPVTNPTARGVQQYRARKFPYENPQTQETWQALGHGQK